MDYPGKVITKTQVTPTQTSASGNWTLDDQAAAIKNNNWPVALVPNPISKSLRFNSADSAYLNRTFTTPTNRNIWTWSGWIKRSALGNTAGYRFFEGGDGTSANTGFIGFGDGTGVECIRFYNRLSSTTNIDITTAAVFRDVSAWYHVVVAYDSAQATQANRLLMYVNGVNYTWSGTAPSLNQTSGINTSAYAHNIGVSPWNTSTYFSGYLTELNFIDGQALTPSDFGLTNPQTGQWIPKKYTGTYGTNGFYLNFKDATSTTTLGYDYSGNANNWTTNNFSVTAGSGNDSLTDVPTPWVAYNTTGDVGGVVRGNYCTLNPLNQTGLTFTNGNLNVTGTAPCGTKGTIGVSSGKWYWETVFTATAVVSSGIGLTNASNSTAVGVDTNSWGILSNGNKYYNGSSTSYGSAISLNDVIGIAVDLDAGKVWWSLNGTFQASGNPAAGTNEAFSSISGTIFPMVAAAGTNYTCNYNFGQRPFAYTPPAGFRSLCTTNLPATTIGFGLTNQADDYFNPVLYSGNSSTQSITGVGFQPDLVWIKIRNSSGSHGLYDVVRGTTKRLYSDLTAAEGTVSGVTAFGSDGFTLGSDSSANGTSFTYVAWNWKAGGTGVSNTAGTITSTVSANTTAGFSIVTYTGTGANATVGHGLGVAPSMIIVKDRSAATNWIVGHTSIAWTNRLQLNTTGASTAASTTWNDIAPTSTVFSIGTSTQTNANTNNHVAYCFAAVAGYSAFGSYTGNGSTDGPFVYLGFRPRFVFWKNTSTTSDWQMKDAARSTYNVTSANLYANLSAAENSAGDVDFLSNGFKLRSAGTDVNNSSNTIIYAAFAESPFQFANAR